MGTIGREEKGREEIRQSVSLAGWLAGSRDGRWAGDLIANSHYHKRPAPLGWVGYGIFNEGDVISFFGC